MNRVFVSLMLVALVVGIAVVGCARPVSAPAPAPAPAPESTNILYIGLASPLTGATAHAGTFITRTAQLAIDNQNKEGGVTIGGQKYTLESITRDTKMDIVVGKSVAEELVYEKKVPVLIGPFLFDALGAQPVTEKNKVIGFYFVSTLGMQSTKHPYSFFFAGPFMQNWIMGSAYLHKFHPEAKTVVSMIPDMPDLPSAVDSAQKTCKMYDLKWLGYEKFPLDSKDFMANIQRALAYKPDIIDTSITGGTMGGLCGSLVKQIREAGFTGYIWNATAVPPGVLEEIVPAKDRVKIITNDVDIESPLVSDAYKKLFHQYEEVYKEPAIDIVAQTYNVTKPFFEFLNGQQTMDTTAWVDGFAKYHWNGVYGHEAYWVDKPLTGINRMAYRGAWASEYINGKLTTEWEVPIPHELFEEQ